jgi:hypothetical protein
MVNFDQTSKPWGGVLASSGNADPEAAYMKAHAIRLLMKRDDDVIATGVPAALSEFVVFAFRLSGRGVF